MTLPTVRFQDELLWRRAIVCGIGVAVTGLLWLVLRVVENRALGIKIAVALIAAMPGAMMIAQANRWIFDSIEAKVEQQMGKEPKASTLNTHNSALNRVFDESVARGFMNKTQVPTLINKGRDSERRPDFT